MIINCTSVEELVLVCSELVKKGIQFEADTYSMVVTLTGGY